MAGDVHERVSRGEIPALARSILATVPEEDPVVAGWKEFLDGYSLHDAYADEPYAYLMCVLALQSVAEGNGGIGCVLVDSKGGAVTYGHNKVMYPHFRSDLHGEMVTMNSFEEMGLAVSPGELTMYSSLEPCPMCIVRMVTSGIGTVLYLARDEEWGMTEDMDRLPPAWKDLAEGKVYGTADCSPALLDASSRIFDINIDELYLAFKNR